MTRRKSKPTKKPPLVINFAEPKSAIQQLMSYLEETIAIAMDPANGFATNADPEAPKSILEFCRERISQSKGVENALLRPPGDTIRENFVSFQQNRQIAELLWAIYYTGVHGAASLGHAKLLHSWKSSEAGYKGGDDRLGNRLWIEEAEELIQQQYKQAPSISQLDMASEVRTSWRLTDPPSPGVGTLEIHIREMRAQGRLGARVPRVPKRFGHPTEPAGGVDKEK